MPLKYKSTEFPVERVKELYDYDYETGYLISKNQAYAGKPIKGRLNGSKSAWQLSLLRKDGSEVRTSYGRVVFCWHHGRWPDETIDHINQDIRDNRVENLREANITLQQQNKSSFNYGASWQKSTNKWYARIFSNGKLKHLGLYETQKAAQEAYMAACDEIGKTYLPATLVDDKYVPAERLDPAEIYIPLHTF